MTRKVCALAVLLSGGFASAADRDLVTGLNHFSDSLYGQSAKHSGNLVFSPYSISAVLSMALGGARHETAAEMRRVLGQPDADAQYHEQLGGLLDRIGQAANIGGNQFTAANSLWVQQGFSILPEFTRLLDRAYHAAPSPADFENAPDQARAAINQWTDRQTHGRIHELFAPGAIRPDTRLVLGSAVYFYGKWEHPFRRSDTHPDDFTTASGAKVQTPFMNRTGTFGYSETAAGQTLEIRYAGTGLAFDVLLPRGSKVEPVETDIAKGNLQGWLGGLTDRNVKAALPRFRVTYEATLRPVLEALGLRRAFDNSADFSGIDDKRDLKLAQVVHKAWIDVNEEGAEAAAATGANMMVVSARIAAEPPVFRADRPFVFLIRDTRSGLILFAGRLTDPKP